MHAIVIVVHARQRLVESALRIVGGVALAFAVLSVVISLAAVAAGGSFGPGGETLRLMSFQHTVHGLAIVLVVVGVLAFAAARKLGKRAR